MSRLLIRPGGTSGKVHDITPESAGWGYVGFGLYRLAAGDAVAESTGDAEAILVLVEGKAELAVDDTSEQTSNATALDDCVDPNTTLYIDIVLRRQVDEQTARLDPASGDALDFKDLQPTGHVVP